MEGSTETRQPPSLLPTSSGDDGDGSARTYGGSFTSSAMKAGGGPKLAVLAGSRAPPSLAWAWHMGELAALHDGELGGSGNTSNHPPDMLQDLDILDLTCSAPDCVKGKEAEGGYEELEFRLPRGHPPLLHKMGWKTRWLLQTTISSWMNSASNTAAWLQHVF